MEAVGARLGAEGAVRLDEPPEDQVLRHLLSKVAFGFGFRVISRVKKKNRFWIRGAGSNHDPHP